MIRLRPKYKNLSDEQLMVHIQKGDTVAFDEIYFRYSRKLLFYFYRMLGGDKEKAQDFLQDLFLKIVQKPEYFDCDKKFSNWIFAIAENLCKNEYRRNKVRNEINHLNFFIEMVQNDEGDLTQKLDRAALRIAVNRQLKKLDFIHRHTFVLRFQEEFSIREIAETMNCKEGTVKSRLYYAIQKLTKNLEDYKPSGNREKQDEQAG
jgi:RNA polymerase sigma-70 factor (ECF subfamily)